MPVNDEVLKENFNVTCDFIQTFMRTIDIGPESRCKYKWCIKPKEVQDLMGKLYG